MIARGNQYAVYIDGQPIAYTTHNELLDGAYVLIGIYSSPGYSEVDFDNVKFWDLNNLLTPVGAAASETTRPVCTSGQTVLLYEDFEDQQVESAGWRFRDELLNATTAWPIIADDNGNYVWLGSNDARAAWMDFPAYDYVVRLRMSLSGIILCRRPTLV